MGRWLLILMTALGPMSLPASAHDAGCGPGLTVQVLGSGGPEATGRRASASYLVWLDGRARLLIDIGSGASLRFGASGARFEDLDLVALTHLHTDHSAELPSLLKSGYFTERTRPLLLSGPTGSDRFPDLEGFVEALLGANTGAFRYLSGYLDGSDGLVRLDRRTLDHRGRTPQAVYRGDGIDVSAIGVSHGIVPALAYRVTYRDKTIVFSGDQNGDDPEFIDFAHGADILIMHHAVPEGAGRVAARLHALPSEIGTIASASATPHLVLSHLMRRSERALEQSLEIIAARYDGKVTVAEDLLCLTPE